MFGLKKNEYLDFIFSLVYKFDIYLSEWYPFRCVARHQEISESSGLRDFCHKAPKVSRRHRDKVVVSDAL